MIDDVKLPSYSFLYNAGGKCGPLFCQIIIGRPQKMSSPITANSILQLYKQKTEAKKNVDF